MPKCNPDPALLDRVHHFRKENGLTINGMAEKLEVDRNKFWRFYKSGRARSDTKAVYLKALEKHNINTATTISNVALKSGSSLVHTRASLRGGLAGRELKVIRKACEGVLALLDAYEAQSSGREI